MGRGHSRFGDFLRRRPRLGVGLLFSLCVLLWLGYELSTLTVVEFLIRIRVAALFDGTKAYIACLKRPQPKHIERLEVAEVAKMPSDVLWITMLTPGTMKDMNVQQFELHFQSIILAGKVPPENLGILVGDYAHPRLQRYAAALGVTLYPVPTLPCGGFIRRDRYAHQFTKLYLWNLTKWKRVIYTDVDTFFTRDVRAAHTLCPSDQEFCGVQDSGTPGRYFNGGVMILRPSVAEFNRLMNAYRSLKSFSPVCEQDFLNKEIPNIYFMPREINMNQDALREGYQMRNALIYHSKFVHPEHDSFCSEVQEEIDKCVAEFQRRYSHQLASMKFS